MHRRIRRITGGRATEKRFQHREPEALDLRGHDDTARTLHREPKLFIKPRRLPISELRSTKRCPAGSTEPINRNIGRSRPSASNAHHHSRSWLVFLVGSGGGKVQHKCALLIRRERHFRLKARPLVSDRNPWRLDSKTLAKVANLPLGSARHGLDVGLRGRGLRSRRSRCSLLEAFLLDDHIGHLAGREHLVEALPWRSAWR